MRCAFTLPELLTCVALGLAACAPTPAPQPAPPAAPQIEQPAPGVAPPGAAAAIVPKRGGIFLLGANQPTDNLSYWQDAGVKASIGLTPVYEPIVTYDYKPDEDWRAEMKVVPRLAERWEQPDSKTYIFHIRQGVKWHDGTPFTAKDVEWAYHYLRDPKNALRGGANLREADTIEATSDTTVRITTKTTSAVFLVLLGDRNSMIQPRHVIEQGKKHEEAGIGTGPYKVASYDRQKGLVLERNDLYWQEGGKPYLDKIRIFWPLDNSALAAAFQARQVDVLHANDKVQFETLKKLSANMGNRSYMRDIVGGLFMHVDRPPFDDVRVRRALHLGVDRQQMIQALTFGLGIPNPPGAHGGSTWAIPQEELKTLAGWRQPKDQDIAEAKRLLKEAGVEGLKIVNRYNVTHTTYPKESEVLAEQLKRIGVQVDLQPTESAVFLKAFTEGDFDVAVDSFVRMSPERDWNNFAYSKGSGNAFGIRDRELDSLIEAQAAELDKEKRKQLFINIQRLLLDKMYVIPTIAHASFALWQPWVNGWIDNYAGQVAGVDFSQLWVDVDQVPKDRS